jgi:hypothetical protein
MMNEKGNNMTYNVVNNPIVKSSLFATPESPDAFVAYIENLSGSEKALAYTIAQMAFNLAHDIVEKEILSKDIFAC